MPTKAAMDPNELVTNARKHMDKAQWKLAIEDLKDAITSASKDPNIKAQLGKAYFLRAQCFVHMGEVDKAIEDSNKAMAISKDVMDVSLEGETLRLQANIAWKRAEYKKALELLPKALEIAKRTKDIRLEGMVHLEMGSIYTITDENMLAEREYREAVLALEKSGDVRELARAYNNFADNFMTLRNWEKAAEMFAKCRKFAEKVGDDGYVAWGSFNRATCLIELDRPQEAMKDLDLAIPILERTDDHNGLMAALESKGLAYGKLKDWAQAEEYLIKARRLSQKVKMPVVEAGIIRDIGRVYKMRGDKDKAAIYLNEAKAIFEKFGAKRELARVVEELKGL
jgi:tetratricopeptide (TPR) repeat protein